MKCNCEYCVYNKSRSCSLEETTLNDMGVCMECMLISVTEAAVTMLKEEILQRLER